MLTPSCAQSCSPSKSQNPPRPETYHQRVSRAFSTNQPSPDGTSPFAVCSSGASGITAAACPIRACRANEELRTVSLQHELDSLAAETSFAGVVRVDTSADLVVERAYGLAQRGGGIPNTV